MRAFFDAVDSFVDLDEDAAAAAGVDWMVEECSKMQLPEGAVMDGDDMTQEEWDLVVDESGGRKLVEGRKLIWANFEGICSSNSDMIFNHQDSAECSGRHNTNNGNAIPRCEAFLSDANYYTSQKTLGIGCLNHDACLQKSSGGCNSNCADCNPGYVASDASAKVLFCGGFGPRELDHCVSCVCLANSHFTHCFASQIPDQLAGRHGLRRDARAPGQQVLYRRRVRGIQLVRGQGDCGQHDLLQARLPQLQVGQ